MAGNQEETGSRSVDVDHTQLTLEEVRLRYQEEAERRNSVESKIGTVLTVDAIIVSVVGLFSKLSLILLVAMAVSLASVMIGIYGLRVRDYTNPGMEVDDYLQYIDNPPNSVRRELVKSYMTSITGNEETNDSEKFFKGNRTKNDEKYNALVWCQRLTASSLSLVLLHSILTVY